MARKKSEGAGSGAVPPPAVGEEAPGGAATEGMASPFPAGETPPEAPVEASMEPLPGEPSPSPELPEPVDPLAPTPTETVDGGPAESVEVAAVERVEPADPWARGPRDAAARDEAIVEDAVVEETVAAEPPAREDVVEEAVVEERAPVAAAAAAEEDLHEEEHGWSFAAKALATILLLLVGAGLGLWAAPRIAPMLPSGMAPVAAWLTPGATEAEARVAALQSSLDELGARVAALPDPAAVETQAQDAVDSLRGDLAGQIDALRQQLSGAAAGDVGDRVGRLETAVAGATTELATLKGQIETSAAGLSAGAQEGLDTYRAELEGVKAEVGRLSGEVSGLGARFDAAEKAAEARASDAEQKAAAVEQTATAERDRAAMIADLAAVRAALASGAPYAEPIARLAQDGAVTVPPGLAAAAESGVETPAELRASFGPAAHAAIRASIEAGAGEGLMARARAFLDAQVASRSLTPQEGASPDAVLSRAEDALKRDDVAAALADTEQLPSEAKAALGEWMAAARRRADAVAGLAELDAAVAPATN